MGSFLCALMGGTPGSGRCLGQAEPREGLIRTVWGGCSLVPKLFGKRKPALLDLACRKQSSVTGGHAWLQVPDLACSLGLVSLIWSGIVS